MKHSIRLKLFMILSAFTAGIVLIYILLNTLAYRQFYLQNKKNMLVKTYLAINSLYNENAADIELNIERLDVNKGLNITILDGGNIVFSRAKGEYNRLSSRFPRMNELMVRMPMQMQDAKVLYDDGHCTLFSHYDKFFQSFNIDLSAKLDNGYTLLIRTPMESITESVSISNWFILLVGVVALFVGGFVVFFISRSFTKPILQLSAIANDMAHLNFDVKYDGKGKDEIDDLGNSINTLSCKLEKTISELKTANTQLQQDIEVKTHIDEMRRSFLSNVSHELKTPISLIRGYAEGLKESIASDKQSADSYCEVIIDESEKMGEMIKKLMSLMQIESGQDPVAIRRFSVTDLIASLIKKSGKIFEQKSTRIIFDQSENISVWGDEFLIEDVLGNYLSNALNHVSDGGHIEVTVQVAGSAARITVFNTGELIPEEDLDKIWQSFYKVDKARTRSYGGNGIGLAVVSAIMKALGKPYGVENVPGGVAFYIILDC